MVQQLLDHLDMKQLEFLQLERESRSWFAPLPDVSGLLGLPDGRKICLPRPGFPKLVRIRYSHTFGREFLQYLISHSPVLQTVEIIVSELHPEYSGSVFKEISEETEGLEEIMSPAFMVTSDNTGSTFKGDRMIVFEKSVVH